MSDPSEDRDSLALRRGLASKCGSVNLAAWTDLLERGVSSMELLHETLEVHGLYRVLRMHCYIPRTVQPLQLTRNA